MISLSLHEDKLSFSGELELRELLELGEDGRELAGAAYRIEKHMGDIPGDPALEIILSVNWAGLDT